MRTLAWESASPSGQLRQEWTDCPLRGLGAFMDGLRPFHAPSPRRCAPRNDVHVGGWVRSAPKPAPSEAAPRGIGSARLFNDCTHSRTMSDDRDDQPGLAPQVQRVKRPFLLARARTVFFSARRKEDGRRMKQVSSCEQETGMRGVGDAAPYKSIPPPTCTSLRASDRRHWRGNPFPL